MLPSLTHYIVSQFILPPFQIKLLSHIILILGHTNWVLCISWSPDGSKLASACKQGRVMLWDPQTGKQIGRTMIGHKQWVTALAWEPYHKYVN